MTYSVRKNWYNIFMWIFYHRITYSLFAEIVDIFIESFESKISDERQKELSSIAKTKISSYSIPDLFSGSDIEISLDTLSNDAQLAFFLKKIKDILNKHFAGMAEDAENASQVKRLIRILNNGRGPFTEEDSSWSEII
jgi:hypothetical protein